MNPCLILSFNELINFTGCEPKSQKHYLDVLFESKYFSLVILMTFYLAPLPASYKIRLGVTIILICPGTAVSTISKPKKG